MKTISVAMTTYNGEKFVEKQLISIFNQTRKPDEVIIVDDCSQDNTVKIIEQFIKKNKLQNWKLIKLLKNGGFLKSFSTSISKTTGDIVFLCDQDDIWLNNKIKLMSEIMNSNERILSLSSKFKKIDKNGDYIKSREKIFYSNNNLIRRNIKKDKCVKIACNEVLTYNISPGCTCAFRGEIRNMFNELDDEDTALVHDWKINIISSLNDGLYFLNTETTLYRLHECNSLGLSRSININERIKACEKSAQERIYMKNIICKFLQNNNKINDKNINDNINYVDNLYKSIIERKKALEYRKLIYSIYLIFKFNLIKNKMYESVGVDIISIIDSYKMKENKNI